MGGGKYSRLFHGLIAIMIYIVSVYLSIAGMLNEAILIFISPVLMFLIMRYVLLANAFNWYIKSASFLIYVSHGMLIGVMQPKIRGMFIEKLSMLNTYIFCIIIVIIIEMFFLVIMKYLSRFKIMWIFTGGR